MGIGLWRDFRRDFRDWLEHDMAKMRSKCEATAEDLRDEEEKDEEEHGRSQMGPLEINRSSSWIAVISSVCAGTVLLILCILWLCGDSSCLRWVRHLFSGSFRLVVQRLRQGLHICWFAIVDLLQVIGPGITWLSQTAYEPFMDYISPSIAGVLMLALLTVTAPRLCSTFINVCRAVCRWARADAVLVIFSWFALLLATLIYVFRKYWILCPYPLTMSPAFLAAVLHVSWAVGLFFRCIVVGLQKVWTTLTEVYLEICTWGSEVSTWKSKICKWPCRCCKCMSLYSHLVPKKLARKTAQCLGERLLPRSLRESLLNDIEGCNTYAGKLEHIVYAMDDCRLDPECYNQTAKLLTQSSRVTLCGLIRFIPAFLRALCRASWRSVLRQFRIRNLRREVSKTQKNVSASQPDHTMCILLAQLSDQCEWHLRNSLCIADVAVVTMNNHVGETALVFALWIAVDEAVACLPGYLFSPLWFPSIDVRGEDLSLRRSMLRHCTV